MPRPGLEALSTNHSRWPSELSARIGRLTAHSRLEVINVNLPAKFVDGQRHLFQDQPEKNQKPPPAPADAVSAGSAGHALSVTSVRTWADGRRWENCLSKILKGLLVIGGLVVFAFGSCVGENLFVPSSLSFELGTVLTAAIAVPVVWMHFRSMLKDRTPIALAMFASLVCLVPIGWRTSAPFIIALPDIYTGIYGVSTTMQIHPTKIIEGRRSLLQAEVREIPPIFGNIYLYDAPAAIKSIYRRLGPVQSATTITLTGVQSVLGFHRIGFATQER